MSNSSLGLISLLPPLIAIVLALVTRQIHLSLLAGVCFGAWSLAGWHPIRALGGTADLLVEVFQTRSNTMVIFFCLLVGGLLALVQRSGGVEGFVRLVQDWKFVQTRQGARMLAWVLGLIIFIESSITCLVVGAVNRPLFDRLKLSREELAYICDATSAPVCILIPLNGWGAFVVGLLAAQSVVNPVLLLLKALPLTFYAILAVLLVPIFTYGGDFGPMRRAGRRARETGKVLRNGAVPMVSEEIVGLARKEEVTPKAIYLLFPVSFMIAVIPVGLFLTGAGDPLKGSGSTSVFWAVSSAVLVTSLLLWMRGVMRVAELVEFVLKGSAGLFPVTVLVVLAFALGMRGVMRVAELVEFVLKGSAGLFPVTVLVVLAFALGIVCDKLQTGAYVAGLLSEGLSPGLLPCVTFLVSAFIAFSTGTSWATFAVLVPVTLPAASSLGASLPLTLGALLSGGVFGDHASPLSDTSIISSLSAASDHVDHIHTQLPYAVLGALLAAILYLVLGWILQ